MADHQQQAENEAWGPCPEGELQGMAQRLRAADVRQSRMATVKTFGTSAAVVACLVVGVGLLTAGGSDGLGNISCLECYGAFDAYHVHVTADGPMEASFASAMNEHLVNCPICRPKFEVRYPGVLEQTALGTNQVFAASAAGGGVTAFFVNLPLAQMSGGGL